MYICAIIMILYCLTLGICTPIILRNAKKLGYIGSIESPILLMIMGIIIPANAFIMGFMISLAIKSKTNKSRFEKSIQDLLGFTFKDVSSIKKEIEEEKKLYDIPTIKDAMKLDGADEKTINKEIMKMQIGGMVNDDYENFTPKFSHEIDAMVEAENFIREIELIVELTPHQKRTIFNILAKSYQKTHGQEKVPQKVLKKIHHNSKNI